MAAARIHSTTSRSVKSRVRRFTKLFILLSLKSTGVFALARAWYRKRPRILCYHGVWLAEDGFRGDAMFIDAQTFERRLDILAKRRFNVISLDRAIDGLAARSSLPRDAVVITIDDGWYSTYAKMLPALKQRGLPATIYCDTGNLLAGRAVPNVAARYLHAIYPAPKGREREVEDACERATYPGLDRNAKQRGLQELLRLLRVDFKPYEIARVLD
jgi:hypothetical protein